MKRFLKYSSLTLVVIFLGIQLIPVERSNPSIVSDLDAPIEVQEILRRSCYDCHSNEVNWHWYSYIAPVSWLVAYDVKEGREELNFSEWAQDSGDAKMMEEIVEEVAEGEMPLPLYYITHPGAKVSAQELAVLQQWAGVSSVRSEREPHGDDD